MTTESQVSTKATEPVIVRTPIYQAGPRDSTALDRRSVGSGIFEFREARSSQQTLVDTNEAPVPLPFSTEKKDGEAIHRELAFRSREQPLVALSVTSNGHPWSVYCNACDVAMADAHFHCSICDGGDYDLCERCVAAGTLCPGDGHWLIKRFIRDGKVINSTTERLAPRTSPYKESFLKDVKPEIPGAFKEEVNTPHITEKQPSIPIPTRTCNSCVVVLPERDFVTCNSCEDFDLCVNCHTGNKHGHHPAHGFHPATEETVLPLAAQTLLAPGRNVRHNAICDGCDKKIYGVRHKCLNCPDWDFCEDCIKDARTTHPRHRFAAIYAPIADAATPLIRHFGIYCDGPLCSGKAEQSYITGVRYKCAVCHDTDFCAACEAIPSNVHNRTHPLIKFKTPVRNVSITTENEDVLGNTRLMGDRRRSGSAQIETRSASTETTPISQSNAATQVQTMAEIFPTEQKEVAPAKAETTTRAMPASKQVSTLPILLNAHFVQDSIPDGMVLHPGTRFTQIWTMRNPGPYVWPSGCSVRFVGGDNMLDVDNTRPAAVSDIANASESNVVGREIQVGESVGFRVTLKAPMREGKAISYWRMKSADGSPFGHRLWCDIEVKKPKEETSAPVVQFSSPVPQMYNAPFNGVEQAQLSRMQALRQKQMELQHRQMIAQQQPLQSVQKQAFEFLGQPYDVNQQVNISARLAAMREQQAKRREDMIAKFHAGREREAQAVAEASKQQSVKEEEEKARKEAARARVEHIKAKILRAREEKAKSIEAMRELAKRQMEKVEEPKKEQEESKEDIEGSQMVFPKLDHQSPASSTYESATSSSGKGKAAYVENEAGEIERSATGSPVPTAVQDMASPSVEEDFEHLDDDIEVLSAKGDESEDDDGFLTDEEYDILDASDHETIASK